MSGKYFGTDGIRDRVDGPYLQPAFVRRVGSAIGLWLTKNGGGPAMKVVLGQDTRRSGIAIVQQLAAGLVCHGIRVIDAGVIPTPAVSLAVRKSRASLGIAVTASHNPATDNGIKLFNADGTKLDDATETEIERLIDGTDAVPEPSEPPAMESADAELAYVDFASTLLGAGALDGFVIVVDTANGAASHTTPDTLRRLGAEVFSMGDQPNGLNINENCGSEHTEALCTLVPQAGAHLGIAHDGDADRLVVCDETGSQLDGDELLAILAIHLARNGRLARNTVVATVMSNMGLDQTMIAHGLRLERVGVGDRQVMLGMARGGYSFGGEASGHIIIGDVAPTGDALVAALHLLAVMRQTGQPLSALRQCIRLFPQQLIALKVQRKIPIVEIPALQDEIERLELELADKGRLLVRYSGTEPKIRVLVEAESAELVDATMNALKAAINANLELA
ncbi:MAG: phosphoglucosamine mutase [Verrucomicrobiota bacterium]|nr:phosphoglucosamine mutase [Verrucomicrobiota bacterium]